MDITFDGAAGLTELVPVFTDPGWSATQKASMDALGWTPSWTDSGDENWLITSTNQAGSNSMKNGNIGDSEESGIEVTTPFPVTGISYWYKTSSESYDKLKFYVDGASTGTAVGGTSNTWTQVTHTGLAAATHTFKWEYDKDSSTSSGSDTVWVDSITLTVATVSAALSILLLLVT